MIDLLSKVKQASRLPDPILAHEAHAVQRFWTRPLIIANWIWTGFVSEKQLIQPSHANRQSRTHRQQTFCPLLLHALQGDQASGQADYVQRWRGMKQSRHFDVQSQS